MCVCAFILAAIPFHKKNNTYVQFVLPRAGGFCFPFFFIFHANKIQKWKIHTMSCCLALYTPSMVPVIVTWDFFIGFIFTSFTSGNIIWNKILFKCNKREWHQERPDKKTPLSPMYNSIEKQQLKILKWQWNAKAVRVHAAVTATTITTGYNYYYYYSDTVFHVAIFSIFICFAIVTGALMAAMLPNTFSLFFCNTSQYNKHNAHSTAWICHHCHRFSFIVL